MKASLFTIIPFGCESVYIAITPAGNGGDYIAIITVRYGGAYMIIRPVPVGCGDVKKTKLTVRYTGV
jgi:hypothetical protein